MVQLKNRWGDLLEDEEELPPTTVTGPDAKGIIVRTEYVRNDKGDVIKKTTRTKVVKIEKRVYQSAIDRRANWQKFGDAAHERASDSITSRATEDIPFDRIRPQKQTQEEKGKMDFQTAMAGTDKAAIVGNIKDMLYKRRMERQLMEAQGLLAPAERPPGDDEPSAAPGLRTSGKGWVPPSLRQRLAAGETPEALAMRRRDENSVRVTNLSEDVTEDDLRELFHRFGQIQRCFIPKDRETGESRGFAFVSFARHEDAARAIAKLDGFGYDNLILSVSWAAPREPRP